MNIIDVTLRDGGHAVKFNWPIEFARDYYNTLSDIVDIVELGYWKQTSKSENPFYNLDMEKILNVTQGKGLGNVSIMIDYHYCTHDVTEYPTSDQDEVVMIRLCARKEDMTDALKFGKKLKKYTGLNVSFNIFNASNYSRKELEKICKRVAKYPFDYVYFADTHGNLNLSDFSVFQSSVGILKDAGKKVGFHLHDHSGKAFHNFIQLFKHEIDSSDTSIRGMGKGSGNLRLEFLLGGEELFTLAEFIKKYESLLTIKPTPYELVTANFSITDNYAKRAEELGMTISSFVLFCQSIKGTDKDVYDEERIDNWE